MDVDTAPEQDPSGSVDNSHRQVTINMHPSSPVVEHPAIPTPDYTGQAVASTLDDDMEDEEDFANHWSMRNRAPY